LKLRLSDDILRFTAGIVAVLAALSSAFLPMSPVTFVLGIILIFFLPGYALTRLIFGDKLKFDLFLLLSIGLSVVLSMLISLLLAATPITMTQESSLAAILGLILIALMIDKIVHHKNRKFEIEFVRPKMKDIDPVIAVAIAFALILIASFAYVIVITHRPSDTSMNLLSENHDIDLPVNCTVGVPINFIFELKNGEGKAANFKIDLLVNNTIVNQLVTSIDDEKNKSFNLQAITSDPGYQQIMLKVYIDGAYYNEVHFWVNAFP